MKFDKCEHCGLYNIEDKDTDRPYICGECYSVTMEYNKINDLRSYLDKIMDDGEGDRVLKNKIEKHHNMIMEQIKRKQYNKILDYRFKELEALFHSKFQ